MNSFLGYFVFHLKLFNVKSTPIVPLLVSEIEMPDESDEYPDLVDTENFWDDVNKGILFRRFEDSKLSKIKCNKIALHKYL